MSTLRVSNIEAKADPSSPSVDEKLKFTNSNGDVLFHLDGKTSGITTVGVNTTSATFSVDNNQNVEFLGIVTATKFSLSGGGEITGGDANFTGIVTAGSISVTGNVSVGGTLTYEDVTSIDSIGIITARGDVHVGAGLSVVGVSTLGNTIVGGATTELIVGGDARITGILTIGTSSITLDGTTNQVNVGSGVTIHHTNGIQVGENILHSSGLTINSFLGTPELAGISSSISDTAVDIFIYDTSKDSDGGAWRHRTSHTSWYNETLNTATRGSRREFPAVAVIVAESTQVTIYDGDDPDLPMWMVFNSVAGKYGAIYDGRTIKKVVSINSEIFIVESVDSVVRWGFITDTMKSESSSGRWNSNRNLADRNPSDSNSYWANYNSTATLVGYPVNDVAMTVLPNAPIDDATGLPIPTIAVATNEGVSVIKDDGTVVDLINSQTGYKNCEFTGIADNQILLSFESPGDTHNARRFWVHTIPSSDTTVTSTVIAQGTADEFYKDYNSGFSGNTLNYHTYPDYKATNKTLLTSNYLYLGLDENLAIINRNKNSPGGEDGMLCGVSTSYNTGWMHGNIKGAFLSDTDATNVTAGSNLITSGDFSSSTGWTLGTGWTISGGKLNKTTTDNNTAYYTATGLTVGKAYTFSIDVETLGGTIYFYTLGQFSVTLPTTGTHSVTVVATSSTLDFGITGLSGNGSLLDNASLTVGEADRSVNNRGLKVFGTITKTPVATGAELVAYSGFSGSNVLYQPYNSGLNPGTGDYSFMCWFKVSATTAEQIYMRRFSNVSVTGGTMMRLVATSSVLQWYVRDTSSTATAVNSTMALDDGVWHCAVGTREGATAKLYIDGELNATSGCSANSHDPGTTANFVIGAEEVVGTPGTFQNPADLSSLTLVRYSLSAPSAAQVKKMYNDEKFLFQENAACTLYGSSDAVTALAYDEFTQRLHVGTSSGRSEFQGLRRINNTTTAVTTAISAHDEFIAEQ